MKNFNIKNNSIFLIISLLFSQKILIGSTWPSLLDLTLFPRLVAKPWVKCLRSSAAQSSSRGTWGNFPGPSTVASPTPTRTSPQRRWRWWGSWPPLRGPTAPSTPDTSCQACWLPLGTVRWEPIKIKKINKIAFSKMDPNKAVPIPIFQPIPIPKIYLLPIFSIPILLLLFKLSYCIKT